MVRMITIEEATDELHFRAPSLIALSDRQSLKRLYSSLYAASKMSGDEDVGSVMREALRRELTEVTASVRRNLFDEL